MGSARALARYEDMMGVSLTKPRIQGGEIATEMVIENRKDMLKTNKAKQDISDFVSRCCEGWLGVAKELMSKEEMIRITRDVSREWHDDDIVTLEGDYVVKIKSSGMLDMTEGERSKAIQMALSVATIWHRHQNCKAKSIYGLSLKSSWSL